jgi:mRNA-degrading endonuclease RelE of RelBE toxin-antitoxin system
MKRYKVVWRKRALNDLADIWLRAEDRQALTEAVDRVESKLAERPREWGDELCEGLFRIVAGPVRVLFTIEEPAKTVRVVRVWRP